MTLGEALREARGKRGWSQHALARRAMELDPRLASTHVQTFGTWERDEVPNVAFWVIVALADALEIPVEDLATASREERELIEPLGTARPSTVEEASRALREEPPVRRTSKRSAHRSG